MKKTTILIISIILLSFVIGAYAYQKIEGDQVASHWNAKGEVDDYMSKFWGIFLFPLIMIGVYLLFLVIPKIDPLKNNIKKFRKYYDWFMFIMVLFFFFVFVLTILFNLGYNFNMSFVIMPAIGILFFYIGILMKQLKRNWFIGIRTPWTLSSDRVWSKTHKLGSILFKILGIIIILAMFLPAKYIIWVILVPVLVVVIWLVLYSYLEYQKNKVPPHPK